MKTSTVKPPAPKWMIIDAEGRSIGRLAARVALMLRGKNRVTFSPHLLNTNHIIIVNASKVALPPKKGTRKVYHRHTGYPGNMRHFTLDKMIERDSRKVIELAIKGMLPISRLREQMMKRLHVYADDKHPYEAQKPTVLTTLN